MMSLVLNAIVSAPHPPSVQPRNKSQQSPPEFCAFSPPKKLKAESGEKLEPGQDDLSVIW